MFVFILCVKSGWSIFYDSTFQRHETVIHLINPQSDTHHTIPKHMEIFLILGVLKMSAAV